MTSPFVRRAAFAGILALSLFPATSTVRGASSEGGDSQSPIDKYHRRVHAETSR